MCIFSYFPIGLKEDFHDYVNCFHLWTNTISTPMNIASYVHGGQSTKNVRYGILNFMHNRAIMCTNFVVMEFGVLNGVPPSLTLKVLMCKRTISMIA